MIQIKDKGDCCGCGACEQVCPKHCIAMLADTEGFLYPEVDTEACVKCGLCKSVCPVINQGSSKEPVAVYAVKNNDDAVRLQSSSGGLFTLFAENIISGDGVVFGARFDEEWGVKHDFAETVEELGAFRGSKYVQSSIGHSFIQVRKFLTDGRKVLFTGTPCQVSGLKKFLKKEYENLLTVEVACHGVPSPRVWKDYLVYRCNLRRSGKNNIPKISNVRFRDKSNGWKQYGLRIEFGNSIISKDSSCSAQVAGCCEITPSNKDIYMRGFLMNLYLRPSCYKCAAKRFKSGADMTIADYWGIENIHPQFDDDKGIGLVFLNSSKGEQYFSMVSSRVVSLVSDFKESVKYNSCIMDSIEEPVLRSRFWRVYNAKKGKDLEQIIFNTTPLFSKAYMRQTIKRALRLFSK